MTDVEGLNAGLEEGRDPDPDPTLADRYDLYIAARREKDKANKRLTVATEGLDLAMRSLGEHVIKEAQEFDVSATETLAVIKPGVTIKVTMHTSDTSVVYEIERA